MGDHREAWQTFPKVGELVERERFDEALAELYRLADVTPDDRSISEVIQQVRARKAEAALFALGGSGTVLRTTSALLARSEELGSDDGYVAKLVDGRRTIEQIVRDSSLGRYRTSRSLVWLSSQGYLEVQLAAPGRSSVAPAPTAALADVLVADANPTQASLARTMLRVSLGRAVAYHTATNSHEALELAARQKPGLVVLDFRLPGQGDGLQTLRAIREIPGLREVPAALVVQRLEVDYARPRLPPASELLVRPIERRSLTTVLEQLVRL